MTTAPTSLESDLMALKAAAQEAITAAATLDDLEQVRVGYLGKKGQLSKVLGGMGKLSAEDRPRIGALANAVKDLIQGQLEQSKTALETAKLEAQLATETLDVTMPGVFRPQGRVHPINSIIDRIVDIFVGLGYTVADGPEIESDYYNFEALNFLPDHPARDMQDTLYLPNGDLMRTHTSNTQIRYMQSHEPPLRAVAIGRC
jgi:phenylalanyl-tRNA synthetase alpha chain